MFLSSFVAGPECDAKRANKKCEILIKYQLEEQHKVEWLHEWRSQFCSFSPAISSPLLHSLTRVILMYAHRFEFHLKKSEWSLEWNFLIVVFLHHTPCSLYDKRALGSVNRRTNEQIRWRFNILMSHSSYKLKGLHITTFWHISPRFYRHFSVALPSLKRELNSRR